MQVLWSRAAQTRSLCGCRACLHAASAISRRTTTVASKRRLTIGDLFTACYSTILGTAVFADAKVKDERRRQWDKAIAAAKAEIPIDGPERVERTGRAQDQIQGLPSVVRPIFGDTKLAIRAIQNDDLQITLGLHLKQSLETSLQTSKLPQSPELEGDWQDEVDADFSSRDPMTRSHVDKMEEMVSKLVTRLLARSRDLSKLVIPSVSNIEIPRQLKETMTRLESLQGVDTRLPSYSFYDARKAANERWKLNHALESLFNQAAADRSNVEIILAKICYNLLVSSSPPSIQTYDILIRCLTRLRLHDLAQIVVDSFLYDSKFMPTSQTVQLILNHYSVQKDAAGFRGIVNRMRAVDGDMRIKKRSIDSLHKPKVQEWALTKKVLHKNGYLREKVSRDSDIFDCLINGFLELCRLRSAVRYLRAALREGMQLSSRTLCNVVMACTKSLDYEAGLLILRALLGQWEGDSIATIVYSSQARFAMHRLFCLCGIEPSPESTRPLPHNISRTAMVNMKRHMAILSVGEKLHNFSLRIMSVETALSQAKDGSGGTRTKYISEALSIFHEASILERVQSCKRKAYDEKDANLWHANVRDKKEWLAAHYEKLRGKWKKKYDVVVRQHADLCWPDRMEIISIYQHGKNIPPKHRLYWTTTGLRLRQIYRADVATMEKPITVEEDTMDRENANNPLPSTSKQLTQRPSSPLLRLTPTLERTPATLALNLPLSPTYDDARIAVSAG